MTTIRDASELGVTTASTWHVSGTLKKLWCALQVRRKRARLSTTMDGLHDRELRDIGISRGEIDYIVFCEASRPYPTPGRSR
jgi:uncharacterized protein YjiS (DUF1127 family)